MKPVKSSMVPYFFTSIWGLLFGVGFTLIYFLDNGKTRIPGGEWVASTYLNKLPFLLAGLLGITILIYNLISTYWITINHSSIILQNLFIKRTIPWSEVDKVSPHSWTNLPI